MSRRVIRNGEVKRVPDYYHPRQWVVRSRLKFLLTRPRLRAWADRHGLIVGVVDAYMVMKLEEHARSISRAFWFGPDPKDTRAMFETGEPRVFVNGVEIEGVLDVKLTSVQFTTDERGNVFPLAGVRRAIPLFGVRREP